MKGFTYEYVLRRNYEFYAALGWVGGCVGTYLCYRRLTNIPLVVFVAMGVVCALVAAVRGGMALRRHLEASRMQGGERIWKVDWRQVRDWVEKNRGRVWLGRGFMWSQPELQKAVDIMHTAGAEDYRARPNWLHGIGESRDLEVSLQELEGHTLIVGSTGTGKTRLFDLLVSQAIMRHEVVIVVDPKGDPDLREKMRLACERSGQAGRFVYFHPALSADSVRIDPLKNWHRSTEVASRVAALVPSETENDPFQNFCWQAMDWIVEGLVYLERQPNLVRLHRYIDEGVQEILWACLRRYFARYYPEVEVKRRLEDAIRQYQTCGGVRERAIDGLITSYFHNREHYQKMVVSLVPILSMLTSGDLRYLLSPETGDGDVRPILDLATLIERNLVLYIGLNSLSDAAVGSAIGSIILADLTAAAGKIYNRVQALGERPRSVNIFIDEAAEVVNDPAIQVLNKGRGAGFRVTIATQTLADLEVRTGSKAGARQVIANTNNWFILRVIDGETQKYISEALPKTVVKGMDIGYRSALGTQRPSDFQATYTEGLRETATELVPPALLGQLPKFHYFFRTATSVWKGVLPVIEYQAEQAA